MSSGLSFCSGKKSVCLSLGVSVGLLSIGERKHKVLRVLRGAVYVVSVSATVEGVARTSREGAYRGSRNRSSFTTRCLAAASRV